MKLIVVPPQLHPHINLLLLLLLEIGSDVFVLEICYYPDHHVLEVSHDQVLAVFQQETKISGTVPIGDRYLAVLHLAAVVLYCQRQIQVVSWLYVGRLACFYAMVVFLERWLNRTLLD